MFEVAKKYPSPNQQSNELFSYCIEQQSSGKLNKDFIIYSNTTIPER